MAQNIIVAPQLETSNEMETAWEEEHPTAGDFFAWLTTPSVERQKWLRGRTREIEFEGPFCSTKYS